MLGTPIYKVVNTTGERQGPVFPGTLLKDISLHRLGAETKKVGPSIAIPLQTFSSVFLLHGEMQSFLYSCLEQTFQKSIFFKGL